MKMRICPGFLLVLPAGLLVMVSAKSVRDWKAELRRNIMQTPLTPEEDWENELPNSGQDEKPKKEKDEKPIKAASAN